MAILVWIILGIVAGFIASRIVNKRGEGLFMNLLLGIVGGIVGGWIMEHFFHRAGVHGLDLYSLAVAVGGSVLVLIVFHALRRA